MLPGMFLRVLAVLAIVVPAAAEEHDKEKPETVRVELNAAEAADKRCLLTFVVENKAAVNVEVFKLDLAVFNTAGVIQRRLIAEMGPLRGGKTMVRTYPVDGDCGQIGAVLVNDISACQPGDPGACLDGLGLSSRVQNVRFYK
jgi:hypothetical protein